MRAGEFARRAARIQQEHVHGRRRGRHFHKKAMRALIKRADAALIVPRGHVVGYRMTGGGVACVKQRFRSEAAAGAELVRITRHASHGYIPVRSYLCDWCGGWHLTSRQRRTPNDHTEQATAL